jgi:myo-inositol-1(or 4)-monophosphatase
VRAVVEPLAGTMAGRARYEVGAGGDTTMEVDRAAEAAVFTELDALAAGGERFSILSEEAGRRDLGAPFPLVLVDPVDGSLNAKQGVPFYSIMLALLDGPRVEDIAAGFVLNLVTGDTWTATRGHGAKRQGRPVQVLRREDRTRIELLALESSPRSLKAAQGLVESSGKVRILGSMALSIVHTAAGTFDAFCAPLPMRVFDMAASLLFLAEAGGMATDAAGNPLGLLTCDLQTRTSLLCAPDAESHAGALAALRGHR